MKIRISLCFALLLSISCDSKSSSDVAPRAESARPGQSAEEAESDEPEEEEHDHDHESGVHLGEHMYELSRRFGAVWYAGKAGNAAMVDYQLHEMHEVIEELEPLAPKENGVDVVARLKSDVASNFDELEKAVESGNQKEFETTYRVIMNQCTRCHADTKHAFIQVKVPDYNPYSNLEM